MNMEDNNSRKKFLQNQTTSLLIASTPFSSFATSIRAEENFLFYDKTLLMIKLDWGYWLEFKDL
jgi:hypothetical protein